jgi:hypothetical protein
VLLVVIMNTQAACYKVHTPSWRAMMYCTRPDCSDCRPRLLLVMHAWSSTWRAELIGSRHYITHNPPAYISQWGLRARAKCGALLAHARCNKKTQCTTE